MAYLSGFRVAKYFGTSLRQADQLNTAYGAHCAQQGNKRSTTRRRNPHFSVKLAQFDLMRMRRWRTASVHVVAALGQHG
jgi:hypothetical protein